MWFDFEIKKLVVQWLPIDCRQPKQITWLRALLSPVEDIQYWFRLFYTQTIYRLQHNGQVCYLRKVLNDQFDPELRRIYINDGLRYQRTYIYTNAEQRPKNIYTNQEINEGKEQYYLRPSSDFADTGVDFIVWVPVGLVFNDFDMKAWIDTYRLASKRYKIETYA